MSITEFAKILLTFFVIYFAELPRGSISLTMDSNSLGFSTNTRPPVNCFPSTMAMILTKI